MKKDRKLCDIRCIKVEIILNQDAEQVEHVHDYCDPKGDLDCLKGHPHKKRANDRNHAVAAAAAGEDGHQGNGARVDWEQRALDKFHMIVFILGLKEVLDHVEAKLDEADWDESTSTINKVFAMALNEKAQVSQMKTKKLTTHRRTEMASAASVRKTHACYVRGKVRNTWPTSALTKRQMRLHNLGTEVTATIATATEATT
ncbi:uncharacterized protein LAESUDRAFT_718552 [Laetiporus sulphureus 93-53]|uniref:Uncharacterized protein n=1 Tax=Laetiporus sulphureus 93-53 TaxID=1314785 RepID=A0A165ATT7_9APHY|nr:uncharacterized protein LAESUDRAFT_718552 [Laetiporus sulphureus 93-53]KZS99650.1 hypothetical protein LAESUDRAFT_718552 [Laetiporus sulphureus 93-53]